MFIPIKFKIRAAVLFIVLLFSSFTLFYFPKQEGNYLLKAYNSQVQNLANTVALGVQIALNDDNYQGVKTAMEYLKGKPNFLYVSLLQQDTTWNTDHSNYTIQQTVFKTFPDSVHASVQMQSNDSAIVKTAYFKSPLMSGNILLVFSTGEINENKKNIRNTSLLVSACILLVGMLISFWLSRNISKPVEALSRAARKVGEGDLTSMVTSSANDEIGTLTKVFNKMVSDLKSTQAQLIQSEKMASLGELTAGIAHEIQNPLNFVNNFSEVNQEMVDDLQTELKSGNVEDAIAISNDIKNNSEKINHHGKRADAIVKNMLQHSRKNSGQREPTDINTLCDEYLRLSFHGMRAKDKNFNAEIKTDFDESIGKINIIPQDIGRVLLNLFNNAFYAVKEKFTANRSPLTNNYKPIVSVQTKRINSALGDGGIEIIVSDNGNGIPQNIIDKIFQPFFTTKPTGQGTGLGLSLAYDIITKEHNGTIKVESKESEGTAFIISLPL